MNYYEISPTKIVRPDASTFTYSSKEVLPIGAIVKVSVGRRQLIGVVISKVKKPKYEVKEITDRLEDWVLSIEIVKLAQWMSNYYASHLATVWQTILPTGIDKKRRALQDIQEPPQRNRTKNVFTKYQSSAIREISQAKPGVTILHGVTGSGKTLVYIEVAKQVVATGKSVIVVVPEIALTPQLVAEFSQHFEEVILTHSRQTEAKRHLIWQRTLNAKKPIVIIGPRSALFMPLSNIGLVVIDECHEPSLKQEQSPKYSALQVAETLVKLHHAKAIFGSATPNVVDYYLAKKSNKIIEMPHPARRDTVKPDIKLIDMTNRQTFGQHHFLSDALINDLKQTLQDGYQALIFHNRRGTAPTTLCQHCGWQAGCPHCFVPLTLHADRHQMRCHICGLSTPILTSCPKCQSVDIVHKGIGTKRIEAEIKKLFPDKNIARFDGDTNPEETVDQKYQSLYDGDVDIIIGTQVVAKGLDLPKLRFVGITQADAGLNLPDFTSSERTFQLLAQVIGRVGRSSHPTKVVVQSYQPNHPAIKDGIAHDYENFYNRTIKQRQATNFPPFCHLLKLTCSYKTEKTAIQNSKKLAEEIKQKLPKEVQVVGPVPAFYERLRDTYRWQLVIKSKYREDLFRAIELLPKSNWQFDLDPANLL